MSRLRVIGHPEILEAALARCLRHRFKCFSAVRSRRMAMKDTAQIVIANEFWQGVFGRVVNLVSPLAQFGLDKLQAERPINVLLCSRGDELLAVIKAVWLELES